MSSKILAIALSDVPALDVTATLSPFDRTIFCPDIKDSVELAGILILFPIVTYAVAEAS